MNCGGCSSTPILFDKFKNITRIQPPKIENPKVPVHPFIKTLLLTNNGKYLKY